MASLRTRLPGGVVVEGKREREVIFRELTGRVERSLVDSLGATENTAARVTRQLLTACSCLGGRAMTAALARSMCIADRQFLMLQLTALLSSELRWVQPSCVACREMFDMEIPCTQLYVKEAGAQFPEQDVLIGNRSLRLRVPCGGDQETIAVLDSSNAFRALLRACIVSVDGLPAEDAFSESLSQEDIDQIELSIDEMAPAVSTRIQVSCPVCAAGQIVEIDPYSFIATTDEDLLEEVHYIAIHYHWSEEQILALPRSHRQRYMQLIDRHRSMMA